MPMNMIRMKWLLILYQINSIMMCILQDTRLFKMEQIWKRIFNERLTCLIPISKF